LEDNFDSGLKSVFANRMRHTLIFQIILWPFIRLHFRST